MPASGAQPARPCLRRRVLLSVSCLILAGLSAVAVRSLIDRPLSEAADGLAGMAPEYVLLAAAMFALAPLFCGLAWHQAILLAGGRLGRVDACARYGVGSLVNSVAPAHLGDVVRAVLLLERLPPGSRGGILPWFGVIQGARLAALAALTIAALLPGPLALLALAAPAGALLVTARAFGPARPLRLPRPVREGGGYRRRPPGPGRGFTARRAGGRPGTRARRAPPADAGQYRGGRGRRRWSSPCPRASDLRGGSGGPGSPRHRDCSRSRLRNGSDPGLDGRARNQSEPGARTASLAAADRASRRFWTRSGRRLEALVGVCRSAFPTRPRPRPLGRHGRRPAREAAEAPRPAARP